MAATTRMRLDELVLQRGLAPTRSAARGLIMAGLVLVGGQVSDKAGTRLPVDADVSLKQRPRYVSRAGEKLAHALEIFAVDVTAVSALDVGASTGGFVDCLLQGGAERVIALDVGRGQLADRVRRDPRVLPLDKVNARHLVPEMLPFVPDFLTMDVSFISVAKVLPAVVDCMAQQWQGIVLIKPQFEAGPRQVGKGGIVRDPAIHRDILLDLGRFVIENLDARLVALCDSGLPGADGNREFFFHLLRSGEKGLRLDTLESAVEAIIGPSDAIEAVDET